MRRESFVETFVIIRHQQHLEFLNLCRQYMNEDEINVKSVTINVQRN